MSVKTDYSREKLIELCARGIVPEKKWYDRDSSTAIRQLGEAWALLKAGCDFVILCDKDKASCTDHNTIWIEIKFIGFGTFESGCDDDEIDDYKESLPFYIPTELRLKEAKGKDWY